jgi:hypothetical protein
MSNNYKVFKQIINMENFQEDPSQVYAQDSSCNYDAAGRCFTITFPDSVLSGTATIVVLDNNSSPNSFIGSDDYILLVTTTSVNKESSNTLAKRVDMVLPDLYDSSLNKKEELIHVKVVEAETGGVYKELDIQLYKDDNTLNGFSSWTFGSTESTTMPIKEGAINPNVYGDRGDFNQLALMFILKSADLKVQTSSRDNDIGDSFTGFRGCSTTQNRKKKKGK